MQHTRKNAAILEKYGTLGEIKHHWKNTAHLEDTAHSEKYAKLENLNHTRKSALNMGKCAKLENMRLTTLRKIHHT